MKKYARIITGVLICTLLLSGCGKETINSQTAGPDPESGEVHADAGSDSTEVNAPDHYEDEAADGDKSAENAESVVSGTESGDSYVEPENTAEPAEEIIDEAALETVRTTSRVNVRRSPSTESEIRNTLEYGTEVLRISDDGEWSRMYIDGEICFIASRYLRAKSDSANGFLVVIDAGHQQKGTAKKNL